MAARGAARYSGTEVDFLNPAPVERMRAFIIKFLYFAIWAGIVYCLLKYAMPLFMPFVVAFVIAFMLKPLINLLAAKTPLGRRSAAIILLVVLYAGLGTLLTFVSIRIVVWLGGWFSDLPVLYSGAIEPAVGQVGRAFEALFAGLGPDVRSFLDLASENLSSAVSSLVSGISSSAIDLVAGVAGRVPWIVAGTLICIIASFFFVVDYYNITSFLVRQLPQRGRHLLFVIKDYVVGTLFRFGRAYLLLMTLTFVEVSAGLLILRVPSAFLIALVTAVVDIVPVLGTGTIMIPWALYSLITGNYFLGIGLAVLYVVITIVRQTLEPRVVGAQIGLYPLLTLICMFIGAQLFGFWGLFGFPITLVVLVHLNHIGEINLFNTGAPKDPTPPPPRSLKGWRGKPKEK